MINTKRVVFAIFPIVIVALFLFYMNYRGEVNYEKFVKARINSHVVKRSDWQLRTIEFYLDNGLKINITDLNNLYLNEGDSISKESNTNRFKVYKIGNDDRFYYHSTEVFLR
jgi:hypothetical protein